MLWGSGSPPTPSDDQDDAFLLASFRLQFFLALLDAGLLCVLLLLLKLRLLLDDLAEDVSAVSKLLPVVIRLLNLPSLRHDTHSFLLLITITIGLSLGLSLLLLHLKSTTFLQDVAPDGIISNHFR